MPGADFIPVIKGNTSQSHPTYLWGKPCWFCDPAAIFCISCQSKVPMRDKDEEDVVTLLISLKWGNLTSSGDMAEGQNQCLEMRKGQCRETRRGVQAPFHQTTCKAATCPPSAGGQAKGMKPRARAKPKAKLKH
ncbi:uncharacterized protein LJ206_001877 [Theristicus caerulescens]